MIIRWTCLHRIAILFVLCFQPLLTQAAPDFRTSLVVKDGTINPLQTLTLTSPVNFYVRYNTTAVMGEGVKDLHVKQTLSLPSDASLVSRRITIRYYGGTDQVYNDADTVDFDFTRQGQYGPLPLDVVGECTYTWQGTQYTSRVEIGLFAAALEYTVTGPQGSLSSQGFTLNANPSDPCVFNYHYDFELYQEAYDAAEEKFIKKPVGGLAVKANFVWAEDVKAEGTSDSSGHAILKFTGDASQTTATQVVQYAYPALYLIANVGSGYVSKIQAFPSLAGFNGTVKVKVTDADGTPLTGGVAAYGGMPPGAYGGSADAQGNATVTLGAPQSGNATVTLKVAPQIVFGDAPGVQSDQLPLTQVVDNPSALVGRWDAQLSPYITIHPDAYTYGASAGRHSTQNVAIQVLDRNGVIGEARDFTIYHPSYFNAARLSRGDGRLYYPVPVTSKLAQYTMRAVFSSPTGEVEAGKSGLSPSVIIQRSASRPFHIQFVLCRVGSWKNLGAKFNAQGLMPTAAIAGYCDFINHFMPVPVTYSYNYDYTPPIDPDEMWTQFNGWHLNRMVRFLDQYRAGSGQGIDKVIGIVPPGYLYTYAAEFSLDIIGHGGAAGLAFDDVPGAVLLDPTLSVRHHALHEILHTTGLRDQLDPDVPSANGYDPVSHQPMINVPSSSYSATTQPIMNDAAGLPYPTGEEYSHLLGMSTEDALAESPAGGAPARAATPAMVMHIACSVDGRLNVYDGIDSALDPVFSEEGTVSYPTDHFPYMPYIVQVLDDKSNVLEQAYFWGTEPQPVKSGRLTLPGSALASDNLLLFHVAFPYHANARRIYVGSTGMSGNLFSIYAQRAASANPPQASALAMTSGGALGDKLQFHWHAADADNDRLFFKLQFSRDSGASWQNFAAPYFSNNLPGDFVWEAESKDFSSGGGYSFRVLVSDGFYTAKAVATGPFTINGLDVNPRLRLDRSTLIVAGKAPFAASIPLVIHNDGQSPLQVTPNWSGAPGWLRSHSSAAVTEVPPLDQSILPLGINLPTSGTFSFNLPLSTNDPAKPSTSLPITVTVDRVNHAPVAARLAFSEPGTRDYPWQPGRKIQVEAAEQSGLKGLNASVKLTPLDVSGTPLSITLSGNGGTSGTYGALWTVPSTIKLGAYGADLVLADPVTGLADRDGVNNTGWDQVVFIGRPNLTPVFAKHDSGTTVSLTQGDELVLNYSVSDPNGNPLGVYIGFPYPVRHDPVKREIRWRANQLMKRQSLSIAAQDDRLGQTAIQYRITVKAPSNYPSAPRRAFFVDLYDNDTLSGNTARKVTVECYEPIQTGAQLQMRLLGASAWTSLSAVVPYQYDSTAHSYRAAFNLNPAALAAGAVYEFRAVDYDERNQPDVNAPAIRINRPGPASGASASAVSAPQLVVGGSPVSITVQVTNATAQPWNGSDGWSVAPPDGKSDPLTGLSSAAMGPFDQVAPGNSYTFTITGTAPVKTGGLTTAWRLKHPTQGYLGATVSASVTVLSPVASGVAVPTIIDYLLGKTTQKTGLDVNQDGRVDVADIFTALKILPLQY